jgi:pilus assembly protein Flp/PilA
LPLFTSASSETFRKVPDRVQIDTTLNRQNRIQNHAVKGRRLGLNRTAVIEYTFKVLARSMKYFQQLRDRMESKMRRSRDDIVKTGLIFRLIDESRGVTAIEYGLIAALIAVAAVVVMGTVGTNLSSTFNTVAGSL